MHNITNSHKEIDEAQISLETSISFLMVRTISGDNNINPHASRTLHTNEPPPCGEKLINIEALLPLLAAYSRHSALRGVENHSQRGMHEAY